MSARRAGCNEARVVRVHLGAQRILQEGFQFEEFSEAERPRGLSIDEDVHVGSGLGLVSGGGAEQVEGFGAEGTNGWFDGFDAGNGVVAVHTCIIGRLRLVDKARREPE